MIEQRRVFLSNDEVYAAVKAYVERYYACSAEVVELASSDQAMLSFDDMGEQSDDIFFAASVTFNTEEDV